MPAPAVKVYNPQDPPDGFMIVEPDNFNPDTMKLMPREEQGEYAEWWDRLTAPAPADSADSAGEPSELTARAEAAEKRAEELERRLAELSGTPPADAPPADAPPADAPPADAPPADAPPADAPPVEDPPADDPPADDPPAEDDADAAEADLTAKIVAAIDQLEIGNTKHFSTAGVPKVVAIEKIIGQDINASQRDVAFEAWKAAQ